MGLKSLTLWLCTPVWPMQKRRGGRRSGPFQNLQEGPDTSALPTVNSVYPGDRQVPPGWLEYLHTLIAMSRCLCLLHSLLQGETARTGFGSTCAVPVMSHAAISSPVAMETTRPRHQLAVQYIIYLFFFT